MSFKGKSQRNSAETPGLLLGSQRIKSSWKEQEFERVLVHKIPTICHQKIDSLE
jgi:hypothetical protein